MGLLDFFKGSRVDLGVTDLEAMCQDLEQSLTYRKLALEIAIDLVGNSVASVDWKQFEKEQLVTKQISYMLNVAPNELESSSEFFKHYVKRLLYDGEVLIVPDRTTGHLYVAESFTSETVSRSKREFYDISYFDVSKMDPERYNQDEVIHIEYNKDNITRFMNSFLNEYELLVKSAVSSYRSNKTRRFTLSSNMFQSQTSETQQEMNDMFTRQLSKFASSDTTASVYAKGTNWDIQDMSDKQIESAKDSRDLINDVFAVVAQTYHIPVQMILTGITGTGAGITDKVVENYLLNIVYPVVALFQEGFNQYNYSIAQYKGGNRIVADKSKVRLANMQTLGTFIASVFPTGALSLNDIVTEYLQLPPLPEEIGDTRVITKNYATIEDFKNGLTATVPPIQNGETTAVTNNDKGDN